MSVYRITKLLGEAADALTAANRHPDINRLSISHAQLVAGNTKPLVGLLILLTEQVAGQLVDDHRRKRVRLNRSSPTAVEEAQASVEAAEDAVRYLRSVHACLEDLEDSLAAQITIGANGVTRC